MFIKINIQSIQLLPCQKYNIWGKKQFTVIKLVKPFKRTHGLKTPGKNLVIQQQKWLKRFLQYI